MEINTNNIAEYLFSRTSLLNPIEAVEVTELTQENDPYADGYVNFAFRVKQGDKSYILKQARNYLKVAGIASELSVTRNYLEAVSYKLRDTILSDYVPEIFFLDRKNNVFITEDLCNNRMRVMRFQLCAGRRYPLFADQIGEFMAKCHFYTSELYLSKHVYCDMLTKFINPEMRTIMEDKVLLRAEELGAYAEELSGEVRSCTDPSSALYQISENLWKRNPVIRLAALEVRAIFTDKMECLIHGDLHTSNIFIDESAMRVIDMEYSFMGPYGYDLGYLLANFTSQFAAYTFNSRFNSEEKDKMQTYLLDTIGEIFNRYFYHFTRCFERDAKELFRSTASYLEKVFVGILQDALGFMASSNLFRILNLVEYPDFDLIGNDDEILLAKGLSIAIDEYFLMNRKSITSVAQVVDGIGYVRDEYLKKTLGAAKE